MRLFQPVHERLAQYVYAMVADREEAREVISETSLAAYELFETLKEPASFIFFLFTIARRKYKRGLWRRKIFRAYNAAVHDTIVCGDPSPEAQADLRLLHDALAKLPPKQREAVTLFELTGLKLEEIAEIQHTKLGTVKTRVRRGRLKLADLLGAATPTDEMKGARRKDENIACMTVELEED